MEKLLRLLSENSSYTVKELALLTGESEESVNGKINEYFDQGIIKGYKAAINWEKVKDAGVTAYIELKVTPIKDKGFDDIAERIMSFEEVSSLYLMAGTYDLAVIVKGDTIQDVSSFVTRKLSALDGVLATATHFILKRYKDEGLVLSEMPGDERCMQF